MQIIPNGTIGAIVQCGNVTINVHNHTIVDGRSDAYDAAHHGGSTVPSTAASTPPTAPSTFGGNGWQLQQQQESGLTLLDNFKTAPSKTATRDIKSNLEDKGLDLKLGCRPCAVGAFSAV